MKLMIQELTEYNADPLKKPVIVPSEELRQSLSFAFLEYPSILGLKSNLTRQNQVNLKIVICATNFPTEKGWAATAKIDNEVISINRVILHKAI